MARNSSSAFRMVLAGLALAVALGILWVVSFGDPAPKDTEAPIEVVVADCGVNRDSVAVGTHDVSVVGDGRVTILDGRAREVRKIEGQTTTPVPVQLREPGRYTIACVPAGASSITKNLRVDPAD